MLGTEAHQLCLQVPVRLFSRPEPDHEAVTSFRCCFQFLFRFAPSRLDLSRMNFQCKQGCPQAADLPLLSGYILEILAAWDSTRSAVNFFHREPLRLFLQLNRCLFFVCVCERPRGKHPAQLRSPGTPQAPSSRAGSQQALLVSGKELPKKGHSSARQLMVIPGCGCWLDGHIHPGIVPFLLFLRMRKSSRKTHPHVD
jgi:hypothetical protein